MNEMGITTELVELSLISVDRTYQREVKNYSKKIARDFDPNAVGYPVVNRRPDKSMWAIDGQQRINALKIRKITHWPCRITNLATVEEEAELFGRLNGSEGTSSRVSQSDRFRALIAAKNRHALACIEAVKNGGMLLVPKRHPGGDDGLIWRQIDCTEFVMGWAMVNGLDMVTRGCHIISESWPHSKDARRASVVRSIFAFLSTYPNLEDDRAILRFRSVPALTIDQLFKEQRSFSSRSTGVMPYLLSLYNKGLRSRKLGQSTNLEIPNDSNPMPPSPTFSQETLPV